MANPPKKPAVKQRVVSGVKKFALIVGYLWVVLLLLELYKFAIYRELNQGYRLDYKIGFALINALVLGKVILLAEDLRVGERLQGKRLVYSQLPGRGFKACSANLFLTVGTNSECAFINST